ncbi:type ISP restriction/modification enzyme [Actinomycetospora sp. NBC_00405]|uniref:type ISP restriction/modification enzyme n=1 Tax=Actinomycetospora sp. NBC_00405 TaxID=2975952 RepID=UPI002E1CAB80
MATVAPFSEFLARVQQIRSTGTSTAELSYYPAVEALLASVGSLGGSGIVAIQHPHAEQGQSADLGLFGRHQLVTGAIIDGNAWSRQLPEHGVVEVKSPAEPIDQTTSSDQVARYTRHYGKTIVTNLRSWRTVSLDEDGRSLKVDEGIDLVPSEAAFWKVVEDNPGQQSPQKLLDYLRVAIQQGAPIPNARALAKILATHARRALHKVEEGHPAALDPLRKQLESSLGVTFDDEDAVHFFRSGLIQTLFYGLFATWVLTAREGSAATFNWRTVSYDLKLPPIIKTLFEQYALPSNVHDLRITPDLDLAADALGRVVRDVFFAQFERGSAVEYFYEPFLDAYDPELRADLGVWYTPRPVVDYIVEEVDRRLREDFGLERGLADEAVVVLDPATGTGAFLSACVRRIAKTLLGCDVEDGSEPDYDAVDGLAAAEVREAVTSRLFGFELLPAPFVIAHLRLSLQLQQLGVPLASGSRSGVFLTNSLTGWSSTDDNEATLFAALEQEREAAAAVKQDKQVLVVLGNPPYNAFAGIASSSEESELIAPYKQGITGRNSLDDLYVRFIRVAERRIAEMTGRGVVAYISNRSFLKRPSFHVMRRHLLRSFDSIDVVDLNGDRDETGKRTPQGRPDPSIFTSGSADGIAEGTAITVMVRKSDGEMKETLASATYRALWGRTKAQDLLRLHDGELPEDPESDLDKTTVVPSRDNFFALQPVQAGESYYSWTSLPDLAERPPEYGLHEARGGGLIDVSYDALSDRMRDFLDPDKEVSELSDSCAPLMVPRSGYKPDRVRQKLTGQKPGGTAASRRPFDSSKIRRFMTRPYDLRYAYIERDHRLWVASQPRLVEASDENAWFLYALRTVESDRNGFPLFASKHVGDQHTLYYTAFLLPTRLPAERVDEEPALALDLGAGADGGGVPARPNLSPRSREYLRNLGLNPDDQNDADLLFLHVLAFTGAPMYREQHKDALTQAYPRVLLPASLDALRRSAALGAKMKGLFDEDQPVPSGPLLGRLGNIRRSDGQAVDPNAGDLAVDVTWGAMQQGAVMPRAGKIDVEDWSDADSVAATDEAVEMSSEDVKGLVGPEMVSIHLNEHVQVCRVPMKVWQAHIGGKQVIKKWLSYRTKSVWGRDLEIAEARHITRMTRCLTALLLLGPQLDESYAAVLASGPAGTAGMSTPSASP